MAQEQLAIGAEDEQGVVERPAAVLGLPLGHADGHDRLGGASRLA